jgi:hypothetical protein
LKGGQPLDALEELHKISRSVWDEQTEQVLNQIHEILTADELGEAESVITNSPKKALRLLEGLKYKSERQSRLLQEAAQMIEMRNKDQIRQKIVLIMMAMWGAIWGMFGGMLGPDAWAG